MPTPSRILIAGKIRSVNTDNGNSSISNDATKNKEHIAFVFPPAVVKLAICQEAVNVPIEVGDLNECHAKASSYIGGELPAAWTVKNNDYLLGHAWRDGAWVPTSTLGLVYEPIAFRLHFNGSVYFDLATVLDPANAARKQVLRFEYFAVVQPMVIP